MTSLLFKYYSVKIKLQVYEKNGFTQSKNFARYNYKNNFYYQDYQNNYVGQFSWLK